MANIIGSPSRYIQAKDALQHLTDYTKTFGNRLFILVSASGKKRVEPVISKGMDGSSTEAVFEVFHGECSMNEINRLKTLCTQQKADVIVGVGGGKILDTAKAVAFYLGLPVVIAPTIASTDAPCSALSVIYSDDGVFEKYLFLPSSPNMVLLDTTIISQSPVRLLISGIGDALATYFEARACQQSGATNCVGGKTTLAAMSLAKLCYETLLSDGPKAVAAARQNLCTKAVENIIEANTYLSGIGFESGGLAAAHAIHNGMTAIPETHAKYHGEKVAFGTLVQLILENAPQEQLSQVLSFCRQIGLPTTLQALGIETVVPEQIMQAAQLSCAEGDTMGNMPFPVTAEDVYAAILTADAIGREAGC